MTTADELRDLARRIEMLCMEHGCASVAGHIVKNAVDHLCALARIHELNEILHGTNRKDD